MSMLPRNPLCLFIKKKGTHYAKKKKKKEPTLHYAKEFIRTEKQKSDVEGGQMGHFCKKRKNE